MEEWNPSYRTVNISKGQAYDFQLSLALLISVALGNLKTWVGGIVWERKTKG